MPIARARRQAVTKHDQLCQGGIRCEARGAPGEAGEERVNQLEDLAANVHGGKGHVMRGAPAFERRLGGVELGIGIAQLAHELVFGSSHGLDRAHIEIVRPKPVRVEVLKERSTYGLRSKTAAPDERDRMQTVR